MENKFYMSTKLWKGSLSSLFNAREDINRWIDISASLLFFSEQRLYGVQKGKKRYEIDNTDGYTSIRYDDIESVEDVPSEIFAKEGLRRKYYFMWRGRTYYYNGNDWCDPDARCEEVDL